MTTWVPSRIGNTPRNQRGNFVDNAGRHPGFDRVLRRSFSPPSASTPRLFPNWSENDPRLRSSSRNDDRVSFKEAIGNGFSGAAGSPLTCVLHFNPYRSLFGTVRPDYYAATTDAYIVYPWEISRGPETVLLRDF